MKFLKTMPNENATISSGTPVSAAALPVTAIRSVVSAVLRTLVLILAIWAWVIYSAAFLAATRLVAAAASGFAART